MGLPVLLVADARGLARSAAALVKGFVEFDPDVHIAGVVLNRVGSERHARLLKEAVEQGAGVEVLGCVRRGGGWEMPGRHLGLVPAWEAAGARETIKAIASQVRDELNLDRLMELAHCARELPEQAPEIFPDGARDYTKKNTVIAVARDDAFCFYYQDNLDLLEAQGARIVEFSPLKDRGLPEGTGAVWLGGGYPELHARALAANGAMLEALRAAAARNMPIFAECGGYMYLAEAIVDSEGACYPMAGILPGTAVMGSRLAALGYCTARLRDAGFFGPAGTELGGHVFHWCRMEGAGNSAALESDGTLLGAVRNQVLGSWLHVHFASNPLAAAHFVEAGGMFFSVQKKTWKQT
ncbi:MAG: hypothetical protein B0D92_01420 [Spirochaeta sp. LUC14_002_19_P3]|nr:MAG: hypothetical protein B0D92_01420 [Spirochaeta sp. LUC14_002_19_P3]